MSEIVDEWEALDIEAVPMRPKHLRMALREILTLREPVWIWGPPGLGKTGIVESTCFEDLRIACPRMPPAVCLDPVDIRGLPSTQGGRTVWNVPDFLPTDPEWEGVVFFDELPQAANLVQSAIMQLTWGRTIGDYKLPKKASVVVCSNRQKDASGVHRVLNALLNRFTHIDLVPHNDDWQEWATEHEIDVRIRTYLKFRPDNLLKFDPKLNERAFPSPRAWERCSRHMQAVSPLLRQRVFAGIVGHAAAIELVAHMRVHTDLVGKEEVYANPKKARLSLDEPARMWATIGMLVEDLRLHFTREHGEAFVQYVDRMPEEFAIYGVKDAGKAQRQLYSTKVARDWMMAHEEAFQDI